jgi:hypothetical protein
MVPNPNEKNQNLLMILSQNTHLKFVMHLKDIFMILSFACFSFFSDVPISCVGNLTSDVSAPVVL